MHNLVCAWQLLSVLHGAGRACPAQGIGPMGVTCVSFLTLGRCSLLISHRNTCVLSALQVLSTDVQQSASQSVSEELLQFEANGVQVGHQIPKATATHKQYSFYFYTFPQDCSSNSCANAVMPTMAWLSQAQPSWLSFSWIGQIKSGLSQPMLTKVVYNRGNLESHKCYSIESVMRTVLF